jgi:hypothetical protein
VTFNPKQEDFLVTGCNAMKQHQAHEKQEEAAEMNEKKPEAVSPTTPTQPVNETLTIPASLESIEKNAEDMIDDIAKKDWVKANDKILAIEKEWSTYKSLAKQANASQQQIETFTTDLHQAKQMVQAKKQYESALAANKLTLDAVGFMELYHPKVPTAVGKLDYYGRQVLLTAEHGDWQQASKDAKAAEEVWNTIKGKVEKINAAHAKTFSDTLMKMSDAVKKRNVALTKQLSQKLLDDVDTLEADFNK